MMTEKELLRELLAICPISQAPTKTERYGEWIQLTVEISPDHIAFVTMPKDAYEEAR